MLIKREARYDKWCAEWMEKNLLAGPHFAPNAKLVLVMLALSIVIGLLVYGDAIKFLQGRLLEAYEHADVICDQLAKDATLPQGECREGENVRFTAADQGLTLAPLAFLFSEAEIISSDDYRELKDLTDPKKHPETAFLLGFLVAKDAGGDLLNVQRPMMERKKNDKKDKLNQAADSEKVRHTTIEWIARLATLRQDTCTPSDMGAGGVEADVTAADNVGGGKSRSALPIVRTMLARGLSGIAFAGGLKRALAVEENDELECVLPEADPTRLSFAAPARLSDSALLSKVWSVTGMNEAAGGKENGQPLDQWETRLPLKNFVPARVSDNASKLISDNTATKMTYSPEELRAGVKGIAQFSLYLMSKVHADPEVVERRKNLVMMRGFEQAIMIIMVVYVLMILILRRVYRQQLIGQFDELHVSVSKVKADQQKSFEAYRAEILGFLSDISERLSSRGLVFKGATVARRKLEHPMEGDDDNMRQMIALESERVNNTRWSLRWAAITLPAIGFIGTVRGILESLSRTDTIVWASGKGERATAIGDLAGELGLSFATTFIALVLGIGISFLNAHQEQSENDFFLRLEELLVRTIDFRQKQPDGSYQAKRTNRWWLRLVILVARVIGHRQESRGKPRGQSNDAQR